MNKILKRSAAFMAMFIAIIMCFIALAPIVACGGEQPEEKQPAEITALDKTTLDLDAGASYTLKATTSRTLESGETIAWVSDKPDVATVDAKGKVTGVAGGTAVITASINETSKTCTVTVKDKFEIELNTASVTIDFSSSEKTATLVASCLKNGKEDATAKVTWQSSAEGVATVVDGVVTAKGIGTATITATYGELKATCEVKVVEYVEIAQEMDAMAAESWYQFDNGTNAPVENILQDGKIVVSTTPARMNLFRVNVDPNDETSAYINPMDNVNNFDAVGGQKFYGYEYQFNVSISSTGNFSLIAGSTQGLPAEFNGTSYRGLYFFFTDGKVELKQSGVGGDAVQATAEYSGKVTDIKSVTFSITRIDNTSFLVKLFVNGKKLELKGTPTAGAIEGGNFLDNQSVNQSNGYGPRFGVVPGAGSTVTISGITVKRSK